MSMSGNAQIQITGAYPEDFLYGITKCGITFCNYRKIDALTAQLQIPAGYLKTANDVARKQQCTFEVLKVYGLLPGLFRMKQRMAYLLLLLLLPLVVFWMQTHIWFLQVEGNTTITDAQLLWLLEEHGIGFWTSKNSLDLNLLKNTLLAEVPQLSFITVNFEGGVATVVVRQRDERPEDASGYSPANILASKGGVVTDVVATGGTPRISPGDVVTEGQLLISGVSNLDRTMLLSRAKGEVYARTFSTRNAVYLKNIQTKAYTGREITRISISFGKKTINFYKSSGIPYENYDKMTSRKTLTLPGDYRLPVTLTITTVREYQKLDASVEETTAQKVLTDAVLRQTKLEMDAGEIIHHTLYMGYDDDCFTITGNVECREEIGRVVEIKD